MLVEEYEPCRWLYLCNFATFHACSFRGLDLMTHAIWGYEIPMPASDVYIALATVASFLPAVLIIHRFIAFIRRRMLGKRSKQS